MKKIISTNKAPNAIGPYNQAVEINGFLFVSGQIPIDSQTGKIVEGGVREQTEQIFRNIGAILDASGFSFSDVVKTTVFLSDMDSFSQMNEVYGTYFQENFPARSTIAVKNLPMGVLVEIETIAAKE